MRLTWFPLRSPMVSATAFLGKLKMPLRWPRVTTWHLMAVVAVVAMLIWATMKMPQTIAQFTAYQNKAEAQLGLKKYSEDQARKARTRAQASLTDLDQWRRDTRSKNALTEGYYTQRSDTENIDATYHDDLADYHANLNDKYRRARWFPWVAIPPDPLPPPDPLSPPMMIIEPGKIYETLLEGGVSIRFSPDGTMVAVGCRDHHDSIARPEFRPRIIENNAAGWNSFFNRVFSRRENVGQYG